MKTVDEGNFLIKTIKMVHSESLIVTLLLKE